MESAADGPSEQCEVDLPHLHPPEDEEKCKRQGYECDAEIGHDHHAPAIPAVNEHSGDRAQRNLRHQGDESCPSKHRCRAGRDR